MSLERLVEQMPALLWSTDEELRLNGLTGRSLPVFLDHPEDLVGKSLDEHFPTANQDFPAIDCHRRALKGETVSYEFERGERRYAAKLDPLRDGGGKICGVIGVALDITERKQAEREVERSLALLRATLDSTADGILVVAPRISIRRFRIRRILRRCPPGNCGPRLCWMSRSGALRPDVEKRQADEGFRRFSALPRRQQSSSLGRV